MNQLIVRSLRNGQITIPAQFREKLDIDKDTLFKISLAEGELRIKPVKITHIAHDATWFKKLYDDFSDVRKETRSYSKKEVNDAIDKAVRAVRKPND